MAGAEAVDVARGPRAGLSREPGVLGVLRGGAAVRRPRGGDAPLRTNGGNRFPPLTPFLRAHALPALWLPASKLASAETSKYRTVASIDRRSGLASAEQQRVKASAVRKGARGGNLFP